MEILNNAPYLFCFVLFALGLYLIITTDNLLKKLFGLSLMQSGILLLFLAIGYVTGGMPPIIKPQIDAEPNIYVNPLPQVLMLTAIVVGVATLAVGLALVIRIKKKFGAINESVNDI
jgi:multicomponent Na+:H+ antiporter subunit C